MEDSVKMIGAAKDLSSTLRSKRDWTTDGISWNHRSVYGTIEGPMELNDVSVFIKVIQAGSFTEAARRLKAPKSTVSAKVSGLERRLGVTLLQRTSRRLHLTAEGEEFFQTCARAVSEIETAEAIASGRQKTPSGRISITAASNTSIVLARFVKKFVQKYPQIKIDLIFTNRIVDLVGEGIDVAIRPGHLKDSSLLAKKVAMHNFSLFGSPRYLAATPRIKTPSDLEQHASACFSFTPIKNGQWELARGKEKVKITVRGDIAADELSALKELALLDLGIALLPGFLCQEELKDGRLVEVLPGWATESVPLSLVYTAQKFRHPRIQALIEELSKELREVFRYSED